MCSRDAVVGFMTDFVERRVARLKENATIMTCFRYANRGGMDQNEV